MNENTKITFTLGIGFSNVNYEEVFTLEELGIELDDFETEEELNELLDAAWIDWVNNHIDGGWDIKED